MQYIIAPLLHAQHIEILKVLDSLEILLDEEESPQRTEKIKTLLNSLGKRITLHLAQEDCILYPDLLQSEDIKRQEIAQQYIREMGGLADVFNQFIKQWQLGWAIEKEGARFKTEATTIMESLKLRINREEKILFPLINL
jgi:iron-sulfur cluster repair protein YtfE (RIC family)